MKEAIRISAERLGRYLLAGAACTLAIICAEALVPVMAAAAPFVGQ